MPPIAEGWIDSESSVFKAPTTDFPCSFPVLPPTIYSAIAFRP